MLFDIALVILVLYLIALFYQKRKAAKAAKAEKAKAAEAARLDQPINDMPSLKDGSGGEARCAYCGDMLAGYGSAGGYCTRCDRWSYDKAAYKAAFDEYGESADTLFVLMAYDNAHLRSVDMELRGVMLITPGQIIIRSGDAHAPRRKQVRYRDVKAAFATEGGAQQLTLLLAPTGARTRSDGEAQSMSIDLSGSYDGAKGSDLKRVKRLIDEYGK